MKKSILFLAFVSMLVLASCNCTKNQKTSNSLFSSTWELDYISGPRIAFDGLFPDIKPQITFETNGKASGTSSCNGFSTTFAHTENTIKIEEPGAMTMRYCEGGGEQVFLQTMKKVNKYAISSDGKLNLMIDDVPFMRFKPVTKK